MEEPCHTPLSVSIMSVEEEVEILSILLTVDISSVSFLTPLLSVELVPLVPVGPVTMNIFSVGAT